MIQAADAIIDQSKKHLDIIDDEGDLSILSHKLYLLNERYEYLLNLMIEDQKKLKDYIEDISHQLKTPITTMKLNEELLLEVVEDIAIKNKINLIYHQTNKMSKLIDDLLTLAKLDANTINFDMEENDVEELFDDVEEALSTMLIKHQVELVISHHHEIITCDQKWMAEAIINIVKNCIEKTKDTIEISVSETESLIMINIQDHGPGFSEEDLSHVFDRFYRNANNNYTGVGIGLAMCKGIIEKHHGVINIKNKEGALFEITIPKINTKSKVIVT